MNENALISIQSIYASSIAEGRKTVELRRRFLSMPVGSKLWIYSTLPVGALIATARVSDIDCDLPSTLWSKYSGDAAVSHEKFFEYFSGSSKGYAIKLKDVTPIDPIPLSQIRAIRGFDHIPQVAAKISIKEALQFQLLSGIPKQRVHVEA
ncbi:ASCH domain-containing protein [Maritalea sp.]|uniref:ASCH domain-containing protein n=1 Tax=Maritalea sp. TaxID=2003361 RepID=UPI003EF8B7DA